RKCPGKCMDFHQGGHASAPGAAWDARATEGTWLMRVGVGIWLAVALALAAAAVAVLIAIATAPARAEAGPARPQDVPRREATQISTIKVSGSKRVDADTIRSYFHGLGPDALDAGVKALYATNLFADVRIAQHEGHVEVTV